MSKKIKFLRQIPVLVLMIGLSGLMNLYSQYILDDPEPVIKREEKKPVEEKKHAPVLEKKTTEAKKQTLEIRKKPDEIKKKPRELKKPVKIEKKIVVPEKRVQPTSLDEVDAILRRTFFRGRFKDAVKDLRDIVSHSDNKRDVAKAKLFIARSYFEMGQFRKAEQILILNDVREYFPRDAHFWEELAVTRIRNY